MTANIDASFLHHLDGTRIQPMCLQPGAFYFVPIITERLQPTIRHLAAARVSCAKKINEFFVI
jgi:hypothetical protein